jgi:diguanylate cyclase (GGDEF)-like protein
MSTRAAPAPGPVSTRQFWLGAGAIVLMLCAVIFAVRAMQAERTSLARIQEHLAAATDALEVQRLAADVARGNAGGAAALVALLERLQQSPAGERERTALAAAHRAAMAALQPRAGTGESTRALDAAVADYSALVRARGSAAVERARDGGRLSQVGLAAASLITVVLGVMLGVFAWRTLAANQRLVGQLGQMAHEDALTGVLNRRALDENLPIELARAGRLSYPLTVVMLDLDHFKRFNDRRGHGAGDVLLRAAAQSWLRQLRPTDLLARYGGEEFTLVLPACDAPQAESLVDRLRPHMPERQTFSAGVATWNGSESPEELLRAADLALLQAKRGGRNRTVVAGREPQISLPLEVRRDTQQVISSA